MVEVGAFESPVHKESEREIVQVSSPYLSEDWSALSKRVYLEYQHLHPCRRVASPLIAEERRLLV